MTEPNDFTFAFDDANLAYGFPDAEAKENIARHAVANGKLVRRFPKGPRTSAGHLIAWPDTAGVMAYIVGEADGDGLEFIACWPFADGGRARTFTIKNVWSDETGGLSLMSGTTEGLPLTVFDTFCAGAERPLRPGMIEACRIIGWATELQTADNTPDRFHVSQLSPDVRESLGHSLDGDGMLTIRKEGWAAFFPAFARASPLHEFRGPIKAVRRTGTFMDAPFYVLTVTISRPNIEDFDLDIYATVMLIDFEPRVGLDVQGYVWLQAGFE